MKKIFDGVLNNLTKLRFLSFEKAAIIYVIVTSIIVVINYHKLPHPETLLIFRVAFLSSLLTAATLSAAFNKKFFIFVRYAIVGASLVYWYPETFEINRIFSNLDYKIATIEQVTFGFQPALVFQQVFSDHTFSEIFHFGYFSYYPIIIGIGLYLFIKDRKNAEKYVFYVFFSFFTFYLFFILFPTAGPQYYFPAIGTDNVQAGIFPNVNHYFNHNFSLAVSEKGSGLFFKLVELSQQLGERPTAAFPSSHVGITTVIMLFIIRQKHYKLSLFILPVYLTLVASTVYIQAHYLIDVIAGILSAIVLTVICNIVYPYFKYRFELKNFIYTRWLTVFGN